MVKTFDKIVSDESSDPADVAMLADTARRMVADDQKAIESADKIDRLDAGKPTEIQDGKTEVSIIYVDKPV